MLSRVAEIQLHLCMYGCIMIYDDEWWCMIYACSDIQYRFSSNPKQGNSRKSGASKIKPSKDGDGRFPVSKATLGCSPRGVSLEMFSYTSMVSAATGFLTQPQSGSTLQKSPKQLSGNPWSCENMWLVSVLGTPLISHQMDWIWDLSPSGDNHHLGFPPEVGTCLRNGVVWKWAYP